MGGSAKVVCTQGGGSPSGVLWVYKGGGWVKKGPKSMYVIYGRPHIHNMKDAYEISLTTFEIFRLKIGLTL